MLKYPHIIESYACILNILALIFLLPINLLISLGICSTPKLSKYITLLALTNKEIQCVPVFSYSSKFLTYAPF